MDFNKKSMIIFILGLLIILSLIIFFKSNNEPLLSEESTSITLSQVEEILREQSMNPQLKEVRILRQLQNGEFLDNGVNYNLNDPISVQEISLLINNLFSQGNTLKINILTATTAQSYILINTPVPQQPEETTSSAKSCFCNIRVSAKAQCSDGSGTDKELCEMVHEIKSVPVGTVTGKAIEGEIVAPPKPGAPLAPLTQALDECSVQQAKADSENKRLEDEEKSDTEQYYPSKTFGTDYQVNEGSPCTEDSQCKEVCEAYVENIKNQPEGGSEEERDKVAKELASKISSQSASTFCESIGVKSDIPGKLMVLRVAISSPELKSYLCMADTNK